MTQTAASAPGKIEKSRFAQNLIVLSSANVFTHCQYNTLLQVLFCRAAFKHLFAQWADFRTAMCPQFHRNTRRHPTSARPPSRTDRRLLWNFENLEIHKDFQTSIRNKIPRWPLLWFHQRFLGFSTFSKFLILFYHITGILARAWTKLRIIPAKLQDFRYVICHLHFLSLCPMLHVLYCNMSFSKVPILPKKFGKLKLFHSLFNGREHAFVSQRGRWRSSIKSRFLFRYLKLIRQEGSSAESIEPYRYYP